MSTSLPSPAPGVIAIGGLTQATRHYRNYDAVISAEDPGSRQNSRLRINRAPYQPQLVLAFEDVDCASFGYAHANAQQVLAALEFAQTHSDRSLLVHCQHGVGRSAALALAILTDRAAPGSESECVNTLFELRPEACPNRIVTELADVVLGCNGRLVAALDAYEALNPHMAQRRRARLAYARNFPEQFARASWEGSRILRFHHD